MPVVMASKFSFNALKTLNTALRHSMAPGLTEAKGLSNFCLAYHTSR